jgi:hypothetical protein
MEIIVFLSIFTMSKINASTVCARCQGARQCHVADPTRSLYRAVNNNQDGSARSKGAVQDIRMKKSQRIRTGFFQRDAKGCTAPSFSPLSY